MEDDGDFVPLSKKRKRENKRKTDRFASISNDELAEFSKGFVPENTKKNTLWAVNTFKEWKAETNSRLAKEGKATCPDDLLDKPVVKQLNTWLSKFIVEARSTKGEPYPASTIQQLLSGIQRYYLEKDPSFPKIMDKKQHLFDELHKTRDSYYRNLRLQGIGAQVKHASLISPEEEDKLWLSEVFSVSNPKALQRAVFYYIGKCFCIRGGQEQRQLGPSNFVFDKAPGGDVDPTKVTYVEHGSKNNTGGLHQLRLENKQVTIHAVPSGLPKCLVLLLSMYFQRLPVYAFTKDILYLRPKPSAPSNPKSPWYDEIPVGKNTLSEMVKEMCFDAGLEEKKTNHSLRATGTTNMFRNNIPEKIIQKTTGHKSVEALRTYERVSEEQEKKLSVVMMTNSSENCEPGCQAASSAPVQHSPAESFGRLFGDLTNCSIGSLTVNINPTFNTTAISRVEEEFDNLVNSCSSSY